MATKNAPVDELVNAATSSQWQPDEAHVLGRDTDLVRAQISAHDNWTSAHRVERENLEAWNCFSDDERSLYAAYLLENRSSLDPNARQLGLKAPLGPAAWYAKQRIEQRTRPPWELHAEKMHADQQAARPKNLNEYLEQQQNALAAKLGTDE